MLALQEMRAPVTWRLHVCVAVEIAKEGSKVSYYRVNTPWTWG